jgi:hypothetical protein
MNPAVIRALASEVAAREHDCHLVLSDYREAALDLSLLEIYDTPQVVAEILSAVRSASR